MILNLTVRSAEGLEKFNIMCSTLFQKNKCDFWNFKCTDHWILKGIKVIFVGWRPYKQQEFQFNSIFRCAQADKNQFFLNDGLLSIDIILHSFS